MNVVREISRINDAELKYGIASGSWHDDYKDSAYIHVSGLDYGLTEGDVVVIFSQYGEVMDVNMPRDKNTGKSKGFAFLMYDDQRSTILAVDNLSGAQVLGRTLKVDHVKNYRQAKVRNEEGELVEPEEQSLNVKPELIHDDDAASESSSAPSIDPEDPMRDYLIQKRREEKEKKKKVRSRSKKKLKSLETPEERRARKELKAKKKDEKRLERKGYD